MVITGTGPDTCTRPWSGPFGALYAGVELRCNSGVAEHMGLEPLIAEGAATPAGRGARRARRRRSWALLQGELVLGAWTELDGLVADEDPEMVSQIGNVRRT